MTSTTRAHIATHFQLSGPDSALSGRCGVGAGSSACPHPLQNSDCQAFLRPHCLHFMFGLSRLGYAPWYPFELAFSQWKGFGPAARNFIPEAVINVSWGTPRNLRDYTMSILLIIPEDEVRWRFSRSGGPGGQNVNKVETRAEMLWSPASSRALTEDQRVMIIDRLSSRLDANGDLHITASAHRTQRANRDAALGRLQAIVTDALRERRVRRPRRISRAQKQARLESKRRRGEIKRLRSGDDG